MASCAWAPTAVSGTFGRFSVSQAQASASVYGACDELLPDVVPPAADPLDVVPPASDPPPQLASAPTPTAANATSIALAGRLRRRLLGVVRVRPAVALSGDVT